MNKIKNTKIPFFKMIGGVQIASTKCPFHFKIKIFQNFNIKKMFSYLNHKT